MDIDCRVKLFVKTGESIGRVLEAGHQDNLESIEEKALFNAIPVAFHKNAWFSELSVRKALQGIMVMLKEDDLLDWLSLYLSGVKKKKKSNNVGIIMAGNLPLVGFHDLICVLVAGDKAVVKMSSNDSDLLPLLLDIMVLHDSSIAKSYLLQQEGIKGVDKIIATGSDNTARYFEYYFSKYPQIVRKSRTSVAIIHEGITQKEIEGLAKDMFQYYGLGCRNVTKLLLPEGFDVPYLIDNLRSYESNMDNTKYINNLEYNKSILLINGEAFLDGGFFLMRELKELFSPLSLTNYQFYKHKEDVDAFLHEHKDQVQCVVGKGFEVGFGQAQLPKLWDYADKVDVMKFLLE